MSIRSLIAVTSATLLVACGGSSTPMIVDPRTSPDLVGEERTAFEGDRLFMQINEGDLAGQSYGIRIEPREMVPITGGRAFSPFSTRLPASGGIQPWTGRYEAVVATSPERPIGGISAAVVANFAGTFTVDVDLNSSFITTTSDGPLQFNIAYGATGEGLDNAASFFDTPVRVSASIVNRLAAGQFQSPADPERVVSGAFILTD